MRAKKWIGLFVTVAVGFTGSLSTQAGIPNIVIILADDQGYADVSYNPHSPKEVSTPNIDKLARSGVVCTQGYASGHVCSPTRAGIMTGRYQQRAGIYTAGQGGSGMPLEERWMPMHLKQGGYVCGAFGKWHLGLTMDYHPLNRGFDYFYGFMGRGAHDYYDYDSDSSVKFGGPVYRNLEVLKGEKGYLTTKLTEEAVSFIHREKDHPFFAYVAYNAVHAPMQAPEEDIKRFNTGDEIRDILMAMLYHLDLGVGKIVQALEDAGVLDNTLIIYLSDNGGASATHANNAPLRGHKHEYHEGGIRVPFIVSWPGKLKAGSSCSVPVWSIDILPSVLAAAGLETLPESKPLDGKNMLPVLLGKQKKLHDTFYWSDGDEGRWAVRSGDWKIVSYKGRVELFDIVKDAAETADLKSQYPEKVKALTKLYAGWLDEMSDPVKGSKNWTSKGGEEKKSKRTDAEKAAEKEARKAAKKKDQSPE